MSLDETVNEFGSKARRPSENAFLTDMKGNKELNPQERVAEVYEFLQSEINVMNERIGLTMKNHEQDYLKAFQFQIQVLVKQLKDLKSKASDDSAKLMRDEKIHALESSLNWFKEEAAKLADSAKQLQVEADKWKAKAEALEDDRKFLEFSLKEAKKQLKQQKAKRQNSNVVVSAAPPTGHDSAPVDFAPTSFDGELLLELYERDPGTKFLVAMEKYLREVREKYEGIIGKLKTNLEMRDRQYRAVTSSKSKYFTERQELESLFLECVEEVRKEVLRRRNQTIGKQKYSIQNKQPFRLKNQFTPTDKRKMLELLISNEQVLVMLYEKMFPYRSSLYSTKQPVRGNEELPAIDNAFVKSFAM